MVCVRLIISCAARRVNVSIRMRDGIDAVQHQVSGAMRQGIGLAGARARQNQQRPGTDALLVDRRAECGSAALLRDSARRMRLPSLSSWVQYCTYIQIETQYMTKPLKSIAFRPTAREETDHTVTRRLSRNTGQAPSFRR